MNGVFTTIDGGIYVINAIVLVDQKALILAGKLSVTPAETGNGFLYKVNAISNRPKALSILKLTKVDKLHTCRNCQILLKLSESVLT